MSKHQNQAARGAADDRLVRGDDSLRGNRGVDEDAERTDETGLIYSEQELERMLQSEFDQVALPTPPQIPGWHVCWLTTSSQYDSIQKRMRLGYVPVTQADVPSFQSAGGAAAGAFEGAISCNEMVLFKIKLDRYQAIMNMFHHKRPLDEERAIYEKAVQQVGDERGVQPPQAEEGFKSMGEELRAISSKTPVFTP